MQSKYERIFDIANQVAMAEAVLSRLIFDSFAEDGSVEFEFAFSNYLIFKFSNKILAAS